jgi:uncharacterized protein DUF732
MPVQRGHDICKVIKAGDERIAMNAVVTSGFTMAQARTIVDASVTYRCPDAG